MLLLKHRDFSVSAPDGVVTAGEAAAVREASEIIAAAEAEVTDSDSICTRKATLTGGLIFCF